MKQLIEVIAVYLDKLKTKNPLHFIGIVTMMLGGVIVLDNAEYCQTNYTEGFTTAKYLLMTLTGFSGSSTFNYLPESHAKKQQANAEN